MARTNVQWGRYIMVRGAMVFIRNSTYSSWDEAQMWTANEIRDLIEVLPAKADEAEKAVSKVNDIHEPAEDWPVSIKITDPDVIVSSHRRAKRHAVSFEISPGHWQTIPLSDEELMALGRKVEDRFIQRALDNLARLDEFS